MFLKLNAKFLNGVSSTSSIRKLNGSPARNPFSSTLTLVWICRLHNLVPSICKHPCSYRRFAPFIECLNLKIWSRQNEQVLKKRKNCSLLSHFVCAHLLVHVRICVRTRLVCFIIFLAFITLQAKQQKLYRSKSFNFLLHTWHASSPSICEPEPLWGSGFSDTTHFLLHL